MIALCVGTGPSLCIEDIHLAKKYGCTIFAINNCYSLYPQYDYLIACDKEFLKAHESNIVPHKTWTSSTTIGNKLGCNIHYVDKTKPFNSGYLAILVAQYLRYDHILLTGYDCNLDNGLHYFGSHKETDNLFDPTENKVLEWHSAFSTIDATNIINCTRRTKLTAFKCADLESTLKGLVNEK